MLLWANQHLSILTMATWRNQQTMPVSIRTNTIKLTKKWKRMKLTKNKSLHTLETFRKILAMCAEVQTLCNMPAIKTESILAITGLPLGARTAQISMEPMRKPSKSSRSLEGSVPFVVSYSSMAHPRLTQRVTTWKTSWSTGQLSHPLCTETFGLLESTMVIHKPVMIITY